jgi:phosphatidylglycerophosphate synthase
MSSAITPTEHHQTSNVEEEEVRWKMRVEEPTNRFVYYPIARALVSVLKKTPVTANQVTLVQPLVAAVAGYLITSSDWRYLVLGALVFEFRSFLDCVDGTLARAKKSASPNGHALDAICDWLGVVLLYVGVYFHFRLHPPPPGDWSAYLPMGAIVSLSLFQGAMRSFAADYFMRKYGSILETGRDETVEDLREKQLALTADSPFFAKVEAWIGRCQHLSFQHEFFDPRSTQSLSRDQAQALIEQRNSPAMRAVARLWSVSNGDFFIRLTVLSVVFGHLWMWQLQLFWASFGFLWIIAVMWLNSWFIRRRATMEMTPAPTQH